jgi:hypothetical protein
MELALLFIPELDEAAFESEIHHIATNKSKVFTPVFKEIFDIAGMELNDAENLVRLPGHSGGHTLNYRQYVLRRLQAAIRGKTGRVYTRALVSALRELRSELLQNPRLPYQ